MTPSSEYLLDFKVYSDFSTIDEISLSGQVGLTNDVVAGFLLTPKIDYRLGFAQDQTSVQAEGFIANHKLGLGLRLQSSDSFDARRHRVDFQWTTTDSWSLFAKSPNAELPDLGLVGNFLVNVSAESGFENNSDLRDTQALDYSIFTGIGLQKISLGNNFISDGASFDLNQALGVSWSNPGQTNGQFSVEFRSIIDFRGSGLVEILGLNSFTLESVKFEDGSSLEDHGFGIAFGSGRTLTSVGVVPEPTSITLWLIGILGLGICRSRSRWCG